MRLVKQRPQKRPNRRRGEGRVKPSPARLILLSDDPSMSSGQLGETDATHWAALFYSDLRKMGGKCLLLGPIVLGLESLPPAASDLTGHNQHRSGRIRAG